MGVRKTLALISTLLFTLACGEEAGGTTATTSGSGSTSTAGSSTGSQYPGCTPTLTNDYNTLHTCQEPLANFDVCCSNTPGAAVPYLCWDFPDDPAQAVCAGPPFDPENEAPCAVDCPEPVGGVCEGHGAWSREFVVWAVYERGTGGGATLNPPGSTDQSACSGDSIPLCMEYADPAELQGEDVMGDMFAAAKMACDNMTIAEVKAIGFVDYPSAGSSGFFVTDHICTTGNQLFSSGPQQNNDYGFGTIDSSTASCGGDFEYDGYCMVSDCPAPTGGADSSSGGADSSSGGDSTGGAGAFDCSAVDSSNVSLWQVPGTGLTVERHATVRGDLADQLAATPGSLLTECVGATMNSQGTIWELATNSILYTDFDLVEDDTITKVCVAKDCVAPSNTLGLLELLTPVFQYNGEFKMEVKRGSKVTIKYYVDVI